MKHETKQIILSAVMFAVFELIITLGCYLKWDYFTWWELLILPTIIICLAIYLIIYMLVKYVFTKDEYPEKN